jgi:hypothetical protein
MPLKSTMIDIGTRGAKAVGRGVTDYSGMGKAGKVGIAALMVGAGIKGLYDAVAPATIDAGMDIAFGDPQADRKILGTDLNPTMMYGASGLSGSGFVGRMYAPNAVRKGINSGGKTALGIAAGGAALGGYAGAKFGKKLGFGAMGTAASTAIGAAIGGSIGTAGAVSPPIATAKANQQIMTQSPFYNQSALTAERLNASGNIVLGMHNQRRG